jgi:hypothetical protein
MVERVRVSIGVRQARSYLCQYMPRGSTMDQIKSAARTTSCHRIRPPSQLSCELSKGRWYTTHTRCAWLLSPPSRRTIKLCHPFNTSTARANSWSKLPEQQGHLQRFWVNQQARRTSLHQSKPLTSFTSHVTGSSTTPSRTRVTSVLAVVI